MLLRQDEPLKWLKFKVSQYVPGCRPSDFLASPLEAKAEVVRFDMSQGLLVLFVEGFVVKIFLVVGNLGNPESQGGETS